MENIIIFISSLVFILSLLAIGALSYLAHRFLKLQELKYGHSLNLDPKEQLLLKNKAQENARFCQNHPEALASNLCALSSVHYCSECMIKLDDTWVAKEWSHIFLEGPWIDLAMLSEDASLQEKLRAFERLKNDLWNKEKIPLILAKHFKIDVETDKIETYTVAKMRASDINRVKPKLVEDNLLEDTAWH